MFSKCKSSTAIDVTHALMENSTLSSSFPNLATLAKIVPILLVAEATVKRSFSSIKLVKTCSTLSLKRSQTSGGKKDVPKGKLECCSHRIIVPN